MKFNTKFSFRMMFLGRERGRERTQQDVLEESISFFLFFVCRKARSTENERVKKVKIKKHRSRNIEGMMQYKREREGERARCTMPWMSRKKTCHVHRTVIGGHRASWVSLPYFDAIGPHLIYISTDFLSLSLSLSLSLP